MGQKISSKVQSRIQFEVGDFVDAQDHKRRWYQAVIVAVGDNSYRVHFQGWNAEDDEFISTNSSRICKLGTHTCSTGVGKFGRVFRVGDIVDARTIKNEYKRVLIVRISENEYVFHNNMVIEKHFAASNMFDANTYVNENTIITSPLIYSSSLKYNYSNPFQNTEIQCHHEWLKIFSSKPFHLPHADLELEVVNVNAHSDEKILFQAHVHRHMLALHSSYFATALFGPFQSVFAPVNSLPRLVIELDIQHPESIESVIQFIYSGKIQLNAVNILEVYHLATYFDLIPLLTHLEHFQMKTCLNFNDAIPFLEQALMYSLSSAASQIECFIAENINHMLDVTNVNLAMRFSFPLLQRIMKIIRKNPQVNEEDLYVRLKFWKTQHAEISNDDFRQFLRTYICWSRMSTAFFVDRVKKDGILNEKQMMNALLYMTSKGEKDQYALAQPDILLISSSS